MVCHKHPLLLTLVTLASANAQGNRFEAYSGCTNFSSRGTLGTGAGEVLMEVPRSHFAGIGTDAVGTGTLLHGFELTGQDQDPTTRDTFYFVVRRAAAAGPDCSAAGLLLRAGPFQPPTGAGGFRFSHRFATSANVLPACDTFYHGVEVAAAPRFSADGLTFHISTYYLTGGTQGDNPAIGAPNLAWDCVAGAARQPSARMTAFSLLVDNPTLNLGNVDPVSAPPCLAAAGGRSFGAGGLWPVCQGARQDGLDARVRDARHAGGLFAVFLGASICPGIPWRGAAEGALYLDPLSPVLLVASGPLAATGGEGIATVLPPGSSACAALVGRVASFQSATISSGLTVPLRLSNRAGTAYMR